MDCMISSGIECLDSGVWEFKDDAAINYWNSEEIERRNQIKWIET